MGRPGKKWPLNHDVIWQHFSCKQRWVIFAWAGWHIWQHLLLKIAMTHPLFNLRVRTLTINSGDLPFPSTCSGKYPLAPHLSIKPCLDMTSLGNRLLLFIAMTRAGCCLRLCSFTVNSGDVPPLKQVRARTPPTCQSNRV